MPNYKDNDKILNRKLVSKVMLIGCAVLGAIILVSYLTFDKKELTNFDECKRAGGALLESYPEQCMIDGRSFTNPMQQVNVDDTGQYIGLDEQAALDKAGDNSVAARVVERDGEGLAVTMDFSPGRLNFIVKEGKVHSVNVEGEDN